MKHVLQASGLLLVFLLVGAGCSQVVTNTDVEAGLEMDSEMEEVNDSEMDESEEVEEMEDGEEMSEDSEEEETSVIVVADGTYALNVEQSTLLWEGSAPTKSHDGVLGFKSGAFTYEAGALSDATIVVDMTQLQAMGSGSEMLTNHLRNEDFFAVDTYPTSTFTVTAFSHEGAAGEVTGDLTIKDTTQSVSFPVVIGNEGDQVVLAGEFTFDRTDYGITYRSGNFFQNLGDTLIKDEIEMEFEFFFDLQ